jgi:hypothetical protein
MAELRSERTDLVIAPSHPDCQNVFTGVASRRVHTITGEILAFNADDVRLEAAGDLVSLRGAAGQLEIERSA